MTPAQCRAARALMDMSQVELARAAGVPQHVIEDFEAGAVEPSPAHREAIRAAIEAGAFEFNERKPNPGVRLRK
jgi:predicted transcriptional regulator